MTLTTGMSMSGKMSTGMETIAAAAQDGDQQRHHHEGIRASQSELERSTCFKGHSGYADSETQMCGCFQYRIGESPRPAVTGIRKGGLEPDLGEDIASARYERDARHHTGGVG